MDKPHGFSNNDWEVRAKVPSLDCDSRLPKITIPIRAVASHPPARRSRHQIARFLILREGDDIADVRRAGQDHGQSIQTQRDAAVRRSAELQRVEQKAETLSRLLRRHA